MGTEISGHQSDDADMVEKARAARLGADAKCAEKEEEGDKEEKEEEEEEREIDKNKSRVRKPWEGHPRPEGKRGRPGGRAENISIDLASLGETAGRRLSCIIIIMRERERVERERGGRRPPEVRDWLTAPHTRLPSSSLMARISQLRYSII